MLKLRQDRAKPTDRVNFFIQTKTPVYLPKAPPTAEEKQTYEDNRYYQELIAHAVLEMIASILFTYSSIYMPDSGSDYLKQYVSSVCIFTVVMSLKDSNYFFPDGTPLVTAMLWAATLYTDKNNNTMWRDIRARVVGQLAGVAVVSFLVYNNKAELKRYADIPTLNGTIHSSIWLHSVNEGIGTWIECIAITFATIPLIMPYEDEDLDVADPDNMLKSKFEANPPSNDALITVALSLATIHYTLERLFQATLNPFSKCIQLYIQDAPAWMWYGPLIGQIIGAVLAGVYVKLFIPSEETVRKLKEENNKCKRK
jgi:glycerol uptake facilitator-like aquaporin